MQCHREGWCGRTLQLNVRSAEYDLVVDLIGRQFLIDELGDLRTLPTRQRKDSVHARQRSDAAFDRLHIGLGAFAAREPDDRLGQRQRILGAVIDLTGQQILPLFRPFAFGYIDGHATDADDPAGLVDGGGCRAEQPANFAVRANDAKFGFVGFDALVELDHRLAQFAHVVGMKQRPHTFRTDGEILWIDAEDPELTFVPHPVAADPVPVPGAHASSRQCKTAALLAFEQPRVGIFKLAGPRANPVFKFGVELLELSRLAIEFDEDADFRAQHLRDDRNRHVVDRSHFIAAETVDIGNLNRGNENHRGFLEARMLADHGRGFEAVELGRADVDENNGDFVLEEIFQRFAARGRHHEVLAELLEDNLIGEQLGWLIVNQKDVYLFLVHALEPNQR